MEKQQNYTTFTLCSNDIGGQATKKEAFSGNGCDGENISPQLSWINEPEGTKSYAVTIHDKDAPTDGGFWHWLMFDIPYDVTQLVSNAGNPDIHLAPKGSIQSLNDFGIKGYSGPCPPEGHGLHQYTITVYALKTDKLGIDENSTPSFVGFNLWMNTIEKASIVMYYKR